MTTTGAGAPPPTATMDITAMNNEDLFELFSTDSVDLHMVSPVAKELWPKQAVAASSLRYKYFEEHPLDQTDYANFKKFLKSITSPLLALPLARLLTIAKFDIARNASFLVEENGM